jgi:hypothetical protein
LGIDVIMSVADRPNYIRWVSAPFAAILLYVLSIGPAGLIAKKTGASVVALRQFYAPVIWLHDHTLLKKPLHAYTDIWGVS